MPSGENKAQQIRPKKNDKISKSIRITTEIKRLSKSFAELSGDMRNAVDSLIKEAAYMKITLDDWKAELDANGWTELFRQSEKVEPNELSRQGPHNQSNIREVRSRNDHHKGVEETKGGNRKFGASSSSKKVLED